MSAGSQATRRLASIGLIETFSCKFGTTEKLNESNFHHWSENIKAFMRADQTYDVVFDGLRPPTPDEHSAYTQYRNTINRAFGMIFTSCTQQAKQHIRGLDCPIAMWASLRKKYDVTASRIGRSTLQRQFFALRLEPGMRISDLISAMKSVQSRLLGTDMEISPNSFVSLLNSHLPEEYLPTIDRVLSESDMNTDRLVEAILQKEQAIRERKDDVTGLNTAAASTTALVADSAYSHSSHGKMRGVQRRRGGTRGRYHNGNLRGRDSRRQEGRPGPVCNYCAKKGHREDNCYTKQRAERRRQSFNQARRGNSNRSTPNQAFGNKTEQALMTSYVSGNALTAITANKAVGRDKWIIDSGASDNLTPDRRAFRNLHSLPALVPVYIGDGTQVHGIARGTVQIRLESGAVLEIEALYVPKLRYSLLSVACLCRKYTITFSSTTCQIVGKAKTPNQLAVLLNGLW